MKVKMGKTRKFLYEWNKIPWGFNTNQLLNPAEHHHFIQSKKWCVRSLVMQKHCGIRNKNAMLKHCEPNMNGPTLSLQRVWCQENPRIWL